MQLMAHWVTVGSGVLEIQAMSAWDINEGRGCKEFTPNMCCLKKESTLAYIESNHKTHS